MTPGQRAEWYRQEAARLRQVAEGEQNDVLRYHPFGAADQYEQLAAIVQKRTIPGNNTPDELTMPRANQGGSIP